MMTGDEHNFYWMNLNASLNLYPDDWNGTKITGQSWFKEHNLTIVNNGSAGAPYYQQVATVPWADAVQSFTTQYAIVLFHVNDNNVTMEVLDPDTGNSITTQHMSY